MVMSVYMRVCLWVCVCVLQHLLSPEGRWEAVPFFFLLSVY